MGNNGIQMAAVADLWNHRTCSVAKRVSIVLNFRGVTPQSTTGYQQKRPGMLCPGTMGSLSDGGGRLSPIFS
jgi:hypothetical protein